MTHHLWIPKLGGFSLQRTISAFAPAACGKVILDARVSGGHQYSACPGMSSYSSPITCEGCLNSRVYKELIYVIELADDPRTIYDDILHAADKNRSGRCTSVSYTKMWELEIYPYVDISEKELYKSTCVEVLREYKQEPYIP